jgi:hypothetical protein
VIVSLCMTCNKPAEEVDEYQRMAAELMAHIVAGVSLLRVANLNAAQRKNTLPPGLTDWKGDAGALLDDGNDYREKVKEINRSSIHRDCDFWKITYRRVTSLCVELDFMRTLVRGIS